MNSETRMPARSSSATKGLSARKPATTSRPPSVVRSVRFSGTRQQACGRMRKRDVEHLLGRRHLEVERLGDRRLEAAHVVVADMAAILAQVRGDAVGPRLDGEQRRADRIGSAAAARVAHRRDVIDVDAKAKRGHRIGLPLPEPSGGAGERAAAGLDRRQRGEFRRQRVGGIGGDVERRQRDARHADLRLAARAVDQAGGADDRPRMLGERRQRTRARTGRW